MPYRATAPQPCRSLDARFMPAPCPYAPTCPVRVVRACVLITPRRTACVSIVPFASCGAVRWCVVALRLVVLCLVGLRYASRSAVYVVPCGMRRALRYASRSAVYVVLCGVRSAVRCTSCRAVCDSPTPWPPAPQYRVPRQRAFRDAAVMGGLWAAHGFTWEPRPRFTTGRARRASPRGRPTGSSTHRPLKPPAPQPTCFTTAAEPMPPPRTGRPVAVRWPAGPGPSGRCPARAAGAGPAGRPSAATPAVRPSAGGWRSGVSGR